MDCAVDIAAFCYYNHSRYVLENVDIHDHKAMW